MLFKHPGPYKADDGTYDYIVVDADETGALDAAVEAGWSLTVSEAVAKATQAQPVTAQPEPAPEPAAAQAEASADQEAQPEPATRTRKAKE